MRQRNPKDFGWFFLQSTWQTFLPSPEFCDIFLLLNTVLLLLLLHINVQLKNRETETNTNIMKKTYGNHEINSKEVTLNVINIFMIIITRI